MGRYRLYIVEVLGALGWWRLGQTENESTARGWMKRQRAQGREVRMYFKTY